MYIHAIAALSPVLLLVVLLGILKISPLISAFSSFACASLFALFFFGSTPVSVLSAAAEGMAVALWPISLVITAAVFSYNYITATGRIEVIKRIILSVSRVRSVQVLLLAWGLGNFMEGIAGYGTAVAIPAGIMVSVGFDPFFSAFICLLANTVSTAFGAAGIPATTLALMADLDPGIASSIIVLQLLPVTLIIPFILVVLTEKGIKRGAAFFPEAAAASLGFAFTHVITALFAGPELPTILGSLSGMAAVIAVSFLRRELHSPGEEVQDGSGIRQASVSHVPLSRALDSLSVYIFALVLIVLSGPLFPPVKGFLDSFSSALKIYPGDAGKTIRFYWLSTPGIMITASVFITSVMAGEGIKKPVKLFAGTAEKLLPSLVTIIFLVASAAVMRYSGMIASLAGAASYLSGDFFPFFSPMIGALGTFLTGSDTSSCILFGEFQKKVALDLGSSGYWLACANMAGATAGKMIAPQSIAIAAAASGIRGNESLLFRKTAFFCLFYVFILGIIVFGLSSFSGELVSFFG